MAYLTAETVMILMVLEGHSPTASLFKCDVYVSQVNRVKLADIMFSLLCACLRVCLCALGPIGLNERIAEKCIQLVHEKLRIFPYGQYIVGNIVLLAF